MMGRREREQKKRTIIMGKEHKRKKIKRKEKRGNKFKNYQSAHNIAKCILLLRDSIADLNICVLANTYNC